MIHVRKGEKASAEQYHKCCHGKKDTYFVNFEFYRKVFCQVKQGMAFPACRHKGGGDKSAGQDQISTHGGQKPFPVRKFFPRQKTDAGKDRNQYR